MTETKPTTEQLKDILEAHGIKPSFQRLSVLKYVMEHRDHPSVDVIFRNLKEQIPTLSRTTVYNTLSRLSRNGLIQSLTINDGEAKFDYSETAHAHFLCTRCGKIYDVFLDSDIYKMETIDGHLVTDIQINFKGICSHCKQ